MWESQYQGKPWSELTDCYYWATQIIGDQLGFKMPLVSGLSQLGRAKALLKFEQKHCTKVREFKDFDLVLLKYTGGDREHHIGVFSSSEDGIVIHAIENASVIFQSLTALKATGWEIVRVVRIINLIKVRKTGGVANV